MVRIFVSGTALDLSEAPTLSVELQSPIWGEQGTQTIPVTIPATPHNRRLLGFPDRLELGEILPKFPARVEDGAFVADGLLCVLSASPEGIEVNIGLNNSVAYAEWKGRRLADLEALKAATVAVPETPEEFDCLTDAPLVMFPVVVNYSESAKGKINGKEEEGPAAVVFNVDMAAWNVPYHRVQRVVNDEVYSVGVPQRYGWSPFLKVWRLLELIFSEIGVTLERADNPFFTGRIDLRRLVVLNNCADACCLSEIRMADLVPECTVTEFLDSLWKKFGFVWHIDINSGTVEAAFVEDVIAREPSMDITWQLSSLPLIGYEEQKYLKLTPKTSLNLAAPPMARYEDFMQGRFVSFVELDSDDPTNERFIDCERDHSVEYTNEELRFTGINLTMGSCYVGEQYPFLSDRFGSINFSWDPKPEGLEAYELEAGDESVGMAPVVAKFGEHMSGRAPWFVCGLSHRHSSLVGTNVEEGDGSAAPIAFLFAYKKGGKNFGSLAPLDPEGTEITETDDGAPVEGLTLYYDFKDGIFRNFWRKFDLLLRHQARTADTTANFGRAELANLSPLSPVALGSVDALVESASYTLNGSSPVETALKLRPLTLRGTFDAEAEQAPAPIFAAKTRRGYVLSLESLWWATEKNTEFAKELERLYEAEHPRITADAWDYIDTELYGVKWVGFEDPDGLPDPEFFDPEELVDEGVNGIVEARFAVIPWREGRNGAKEYDFEEVEITVRGVVSGLRPIVRVVGY